jgi:hypothetical protein
MNRHVLAALCALSLAGFAAAPAAAQSYTIGDGLCVNATTPSVSAKDCNLVPAGIGTVNLFTALQTDEGLTTTQPGWYAEITGDANARARFGLNSTDIPSLAFGPGTAVRDTFLERAGAANFRFGSPDAASPVAQIASVQNVVAGTSNTAGVVWDFYDSAGTGNAASGGFAWYTHPLGSSGTGQNSAVSEMTLSSAGVLALSGNTVPTLSQTQTWTAAQIFTNGDLQLLGSSTGHTLLQSGLSGSGNNTLTFPTTASDTLAALGTAETWSAAQIFTNSDLQLLGSSTGHTTFTSANAGSSNYTSTFPAYTGYVMETTTSSPAQGDVAYYNGSNWIDLGAGTAGQSLQTQGASANPHWASNLSGYSGTLMVTTAAGVTDYFALQGPTPSAQTTASVVASTLDRSGTLGAVSNGKFTCTVGVAPGTGFSDVCGIANNSGTPTAITCTISNTATNCVDTTDTVSAAASSG